MIKKKLIKKKLKNPNRDNSLFNNFIIGLQELI